MTSNNQENYSFTNEDRALLASLTVPIPSNEQKRIEILRQSKLTDETVIESGFSRFTSLATRLFDMPYAAISFVEIDSVHFQSKVGFEVEGLSRNDWFDAYTILPESSEVYVIADTSIDQRFREKSFVRSSPRIRFYAGAAIIIDDVKIGVLSIMDTEPHNYFGLEDKENLLDLGAAVAQLAKEKLQKTLNLSAERANIVVSMMHHLRTPMTSLNFATSLLCNDIQQIKADASTDPTRPEVNPIPEAEQKDHYSLDQNHQENNNNNNNELKQIPALFQSFESSFNEINMALNQLNVLVDSSLSLGQAIIKCSHQDTMTSPLLSPGNNNNNNNNAERGGAGNNPNASSSDPRKNKFSECHLIDYLRDMFHHHLPIHNNNLDIEWIIETTDLARGSHVTFPDAIMLIVISTVSHMSTEYNSLGFYFSFLPSEEEEFEYPELINKMIEGKLSIKILAKDERLVSSSSAAVPAASASSPGAGNNTGGTMSSSAPTPVTNHQSNTNVSTLPSFAALNSMSIDTDGAELLTKQNFLSIDKILRAINGSSKEYIEDITKFGLLEGNVKDQRTIHEFFIPCKVLLHSQYQGKGNNHPHHHVASPNGPQRVRLYRPPASNTFGLNDAGIKVTYENDDPSSLDRDLVFTNHLSTLPEDSAENATRASTDAGKVTSTTAPAAPPAPAVPPPRTLRVLVVEDTIPVQKLLTRWLQNHGCEVTCANNGKIGLDYLTSQTFDITFVDFLMPVMLGITTMKLYQEFINNVTPETQDLIESNKELLIVGMSATALESEQEEAFNYGMHFFCPKPVSLELLTIVLQAKREFNSNEDAVDRICALINTNGEEAKPSSTTNPLSSSTGGPPDGSSNPSASVNANTTTAVSNNNNNNNNNHQSNNGNQESKEDKNKWILFRTKKTKVHPDEHN